MKRILFILMCLSVGMIVNGQIKDSTAKQTTPIKRTTAVPNAHVMIETELPGTDIGGGGSSGGGGGSGGGISIPDYSEYLNSTIPYGEYICILYATAYSGLNYDCDKCPGTNYFTISVYTTTKRLFSRTGMICSGGSIRDSAKFNNWEKITSVSTVGKREWKNAFNCKGYEDSKYNTFPSPTTSFYQYTATGYIPNWTSSISFDIKPKEINIYDDKGDTNAHYNLTDQNEISLYATKGFFADAYKWEYKIINSDSSTIKDWTLLPNGTDPSVLTVSTETFPYNFIETLVRNQYKIQIRIYHNTALTSNTVTLIPRLQAPTITKITPIQSTCYKEAKGKMEITLDRQLKDGEKFGVFIRNHIYIAEKEATSTIVTFDNLPAGEYEVKYIGQYPVGYATYVNSYGINKENITTLDTVRYNQITVRDAKPFAFEIDSQKNISCHGGSDGEIKVKVINQTLSYTVIDKDINSDISGRSLTNLISWPPLTNPINDTFMMSVLDNTNNTNVDINGLSLTSAKSGNYTIRVKNNNGCYAKDSSGGIIQKQVVLTQPTAISAELLSKTDAVQYGGYGTALIKVSGGNSSYICSWGNTTTQKIDAKNNPINISLPAGVHNFIIKDAMNLSCTTSQQVTITEPDSLKINVTTVNASCSEKTDGKAIVSKSGGVPGYTTSYRLGQGEWIPVYGNTIGNLSPGTYTVEVSDANSIKKAVSFVITEPQKLSIESITSEDAKCYNESSGSIRVQKVSGGTAPYTYWFNGEKAGNNTLSNIPKGTYSVQISDINQCVTEQWPIIINQPPNLLVSAELLVGTPSAPESADGNVILSPSGGTPGYTYKWLHDVGTGSVRTDLKARDEYYKFEVRDQNQCVKLDSIRITYPLEAKIEILSPISCDGDLNGALKVTAVGGIGTNYTYQWYTSSDDLLGTTAIQENIGVGNYYVEVWDEENNNVETAKFQFTEPDPINIQGEPVTPSRHDAADGKITLNATGGTGNLYYSWNENLSGKAHMTNKTATISNLTAKDEYYKLYVSDDKGCKKTWQGRVLYPLTTTLTIQDSIRCADSTGCLQASTVGGVTGKGYRYEWKSLTDNHTFSIQSDRLENRPSALYEVTAIDGENNKVRDTLFIPQPTAVKIIVDTILPSRYDASDGEIHLNVSGGIAPYQFVWTHDHSKENKAKNIPARDLAYQAIVKDQNQCTHPVYTRLVYPLSMNITIEKSISCYGYDDGILSVFAYGGIGKNYTYTWEKITDFGTYEMATTEKIEDLSAGTYKITVSDAENNSIRDTIVLIEPEALRFEYQVIHPNCYGYSDGEIILTQKQGGTPPYKFLFENSSIHSDTIRGLSDGNYRLAMTDQNGCTNEKNSRLQQPDSIIIIRHVTLPSQYDTADGSIRMEVSGGTPGYTFQWIHPKNTAEAILKDIPARDEAYEVYITDAKGCMKKDAVRVIYPLTAITGIADSISCALSSDGRLKTFAFGGIGKNYRYDWSKQIDGEFINLDQHDSIAGQLPEGTYRIKITDVEDNSIYDTFVFQAPEPLQVALTKQEPACYGYHNGTVQAQITGGTTPYAFYWEHAGNDNSLTLHELEAGTYKIHINDHRGCRASDSIVVEQPDSLNLFATINLPSEYDRADGSIEVDVKGGTMPYHYKWLNQNENKAVLKNVKASDTAYTIEVTDNQNCSKQWDVRVIYPLFATVETNGFIACAGDLTASLTASAFGGVGKDYRYEWLDANDSSWAIETERHITDLGTGFYRVRVTDKENNTAHSPWIEVSEPDSLKAQIALSLPSDYGLSDGHIALTVQGGVAPYEYLWKDGFGNHPDVNNLQARDAHYPVTVVDANGCILPLQPRLIMPIKPIIRIVDSISCSEETDGTLAASALGGVGQHYTFVWYKRDLSSGNQDIGNENVLQHIGPGIYQVKVTDEEGNSMLSEEFPFYDPSSLNMALSTTDLLCKYDEDGQITASVVGGTPPYAYQWYDYKNKRLFEGKAQIKNLSEGQYQVIVNDSRSCMISADTVIVSPTLLEAQMSHNPPRAYNYNDASAWVTAKGGTLPYSYLWKSLNSTNDSVFNLMHGTYAVVVTDANGCQTQTSGSIENPPLLELEIRQTGIVSCFQKSDAVIQIQSEGGVGKHVYTLYKEKNGEWTEPKDSDQPAFAHLAAGVYRVKVTDANQITAYSNKLEITQPDKLAAVIEVENVRCFGENTGQLEVVVTGGTWPYAYVWNEQQKTENRAQLKGLPTGAYEVRVSDSNGCAVSAQAVITSPDPVSLKSAEVMQPICYGDSTGYIIVEPVGGMQPYTYKWNDLSEKQTINQLAEGTYRLQITDSFQCRYDTAFEILNPQPFLIDIGSDRVLCKDQTAVYGCCLDDSLAVYRWYKDEQHIADTCSIDVSEAGTYKLIIWDKNLCRAEDSVNVEKITTVIHNTMAAPTIVAKDVLVKLVNEDFGLPETIRWILPNDPNVWIHDTNQKTAALVFFEKGEYNVAMRSDLGFCYAVNEKTIQVVDKEEIKHYDMQEEPFVKTFMVYPNPSSGQVSVKIELREEASIDLILSDMAGVLINKKTLNGSKTHHVEYNLSGRKGIFPLMLHSEHAVVILKIVIS